MKVAVILIGVGYLGIVPKSLEKRLDWLVSLFNGISAFVDCLMHKTSLEKISSGTI